MARKGGPSKPRQTNTTSQRHAADDIYQSLLLEAEVAEPPSRGGRSPKRRKITQPRSSPYSALFSEAGIHRASSPASALGASQYVEVSSENDDSDDLDFEDVVFPSDHTALDQREAGESAIEDVSVSITHGDDTTQRNGRRRTNATKFERARMILLHKMHVLCLLVHCIYVNSRCNNAVVHSRLLRLLDRKLKSYLNPDRNISQFQQNRSFIEGLQQALRLFNASFRITQESFTRPTWISENPAKSGKAPPKPMGVKDFVDASKTLTGSQDTGNQLFCAMLRSVGVSARLVCSLQVHPVRDSSLYANKIDTAISPQVLKPLFDANPEAIDPPPASSPRKAASRRLGRPNFSQPLDAAFQSTTIAVPTSKLSSPIFWVEAFDHAYQKWIPVDPLVTQTVNKPSKLEPPMSHDSNRMSYVVAFEDDGHALDVTRRYARAYNAKTRRLRVEGTSSDGAIWWLRTMKIFQDKGPSNDQRQIEAAELSQAEAREGMPTSIVDFNGHPFYALERHLKKHEIVHPKREVGKVNAGTSAKPRIESVYRRRDVLACKSADKWFRLGRSIKQGEQPLKHSVARMKRRESISNQEISEEHNNEKVALYAESQTELYIPPPIQHGRVTKNGFGNIDVYVPSMIPAGGIHVRHEFAKRAANMLRIHYADAVTGFKFQGRRGAAVIEGVVIAEQYAAAVDAVIEALEEEAVQSQSQARSLEALQLWKRFLTGLRIFQRVSAYGSEDKAEKHVHDDSSRSGAPEEAGGGFFLENVEHDLPSAGMFSAIELKGMARVTKSRKRLSQNSSEEISREPSVDKREEDTPAAFPTRESLNVAPTSAHGLQEAVSQSSDHLGGGGFIANEDEDVEPSHAKAIVSLTEIGENQGTANDVRKNEFEADDILTDSPHLPVASAKNGYPNENLTSVDSMRAVKDNSVLTKSGKSEESSLENDADRLSPIGILNNDEQDNDSGSMISYDPEDEEADPDWLESD